VGIVERCGLWSTLSPHSPKIFPSCNAARAYQHPAGSSPIGATVNPDQVRRNSRRGSDDAQHRTEEHAIDGLKMASNSVARTRSMRRLA